MLFPSLSGRPAKDTVSGNTYVLEAARTALFWDQRVPSLASRSTGNLALPLRSCLAQAYA